LRIHIPPSYPPESMVLFVLSTWHVLAALLISRVGVSPKRDSVAQAELPMTTRGLEPEGA